MAEPNTYNAFRIRENKKEALSGAMKFGPWGMPNGWYTLPSWRLWKRFGVATMSVLETLTESDINASPDSPFEPGININETEFKSTKTYEFTATVPFSDFWRGAPGDRPAGLSLWDHISRTAYGDGLYHASGNIVILGESSTHTVERNIFRPYDGPPSDILLNDFTTYDENASYSMEYASDPANLNGLATPCRMTADEALHSSRGFNDGGDDGVRLYTPFEVDPDGNPGNETDGWNVEKYFSDITLAMLASGNWSGDFQLTEGAVSKDFTNGGYHRKNFTRSGHFSLIFG